jgi:cell division transport system ATP-binding protein
LVSWSPAIGTIAARRRSTGGREETATGVVRFENVGMRYGEGPEVLRDLDFELEPGAFYFLTGASGAGKSSLLRLMYLAHRPSRGVITMFERDVSTLDRDETAALRRRIGVVFQDFRLLDHLSAFDNVALPMRVAGDDENTIRHYVEDLLARFGLADSMDARPATLAGGEQQRVAIARAVITDPRLLLADEPTGNVDDDTAMTLLDLFQLMNRHGTCVVIATHSEALVARFAYPRFHLEHGSLRLISSPQRAVG